MILYGQVTFFQIILAQGQAENFNFFTPLIWDRNFKIKQTMSISRCLCKKISNITFAIFLIESTTGGTTEDAPTDQNEEQVIITKFVFCFTWDFHLRTFLQILPICKLLKCNILYA